MIIDEKKGGGNHLQDYNVETGEYVDENAANNSSKISTNNVNSNNRRPVHYMVSLLVGINGTATKVMDDLLTNRNFKITKHFIERLENRKIRIIDVIDTIMYPLIISDVKIDEQGRKSFLQIGRNCVLVINPNDNRIVTIYRLSTKEYEKIKNGGFDND